MIHIRDIGRVERWVYACAASLNNKASAIAVFGRATKTEMHAGLVNNMRATMERLKPVFRPGVGLTSLGIDDPFKPPLKRC
jgi:hypothetical protein